MTKTADVLIVGGGIAGISLAARLSPHAKVRVLEKEQFTCYHATGRSAAVFIRNYGNDVIRSLNGHSQAYLVDGGYLSRRGELLVATADEMARIHKHGEGSSTVEIIGEEDLCKLVPILRRGVFSGGALERDAFDIDVDLLVQDFARSVRQQGGFIDTSTEIRRIEKRGQTWILEADGEEYQSPLMVNAAGAWADQIAELAGVKPVGLRPLRRSAVMVPYSNPDIQNWPLVASASETWYFKPESGQLMVSPADEDQVEPHDAWPDDLVIATGLDRFQKATTVEVRQIGRKWAGLRTFAPDRSPVVGRDPSDDSFVWLAGQGGYGVQTAPALSRLCADLCLGTSDGWSPSLLGALSPTRDRGSAAGQS